MSETKKDRYNILIVDDQLKNIQVLGGILRDQGYQINVAQDGLQALENVKAMTPDLILMDVMMPEMNGYEVCQKLKADKTVNDVPVIFLTAKTETEDIVKGFEVGGVDYVIKPYVPAELLARVKTHLELKNLRSRIEHLANHDTLTDLPTLRLASDRLDVAINHAKRGGEKVALLFLDLDGFKQVNDTHGHEAGDAILQSVAQRILHVIRSSDTGCRIGGDEFLVILGGLTDDRPAKEVCRRLIESIGEKVIYKDTELTVGVSIGAALYPDHASDSTSLRRRADDVMYKVKNSGKNNYLFAED